MKHWASNALQTLNESLNPVPHEINEIDWKAQLSSNSERLAEHLIAFANHPNGGCLAFGIQNDGAVNGIKSAEIERIMGTLTNLGRDALEPPVVLDHAAVAFGGATILLVQIPEQRVKPVHRRGKSIEEAWVRSGGTTRKASRQEIGALILHSKTPRWEELRASSLLTLEEVIRLLDVEGIARLLQRPLPSTNDALAQWLHDEGITTADGHGHYITNFGAIAAARQFEDFPTLERKRIRVIRYRGTNKIETIDERKDQQGYAVGFEGLVAYLTQVLPHSEVIQQALRRNVCVYPEIALRELVANALIHQDFALMGTGPMIEIYDDRIEFVNPGTLLPGKKADRLIRATPQSRNEKLAHSFQRFRICEERGTGFEKVVGAIEIYGLPPLSIETYENSFRVVLYAPRSFSEMPTSERIEACYQHAVLQYVSSKSLTNTSLRERFKLNEKQRNQVTNLIADAVAANRIKRKDTGSGKKFAEYVPYWA